MSEELYSTQITYNHNHRWNPKTLMTEPDDTGHRHNIPDYGRKATGKLFLPVNTSTAYYFVDGGYQPHVHGVPAIPEEEPYDWSHSFDNMIKPGVLYRIELMNGTHQYHYALALQQLVDGKPIALKCDYGIIFNWDNIISVKEVYGSVNGTPAQGAGTSR